VPPTAKTPLVALATEDLVRHLGSGDGVTLQSVALVKWPNACLGVYGRTVVCAEVITPGFRILLVANGETYDSHTDAGSRAVLVK